MKKIAMLLSFLVVVFLAVWAMPSYAKAVPITEENISQLKGAWEGTRCLSINNRPSKCFPMELEINNDCSPLRGMLIVQAQMGDPQRIPFKNGVIDEKGRLSIEWDSRTWILLTLQSSGELKGECRFIQGLNDFKGNIILKKK
jgi:hypothetical protein